MKKYEGRIRQYKVARYVDGMEPKAQELFSLAFNNRTFPLDVWKWRFLQNPCMNRRVTSLWDGEKLVAMTALTPSYATVNQKTMIAAVSGTSMARAEYMGVSLQLFRECREQNADIPLIYGFPNKNSYKITTRYVGHRHIGEMAFWSCAPRVMETSGIMRISEFTDAYGELYKHIMKDYSFITNRTRDFLNWRFVEIPFPNYEIYSVEKEDTPLGYMVIDEYTENGKTQLQIVDYLAVTEDVLYELFAHAIHLAWERHCDSVKTWMSSQRYTNVMKELEFEYGEHPFPMTVWDGNMELHDAYITMSNSDIF